MHVAFFGGNEQGADIYYCTAPAMEAGRASAWSPPVLVGEDAGPSSSAALASDGMGNPFIVYSGRREGVGLYAVHSPDGGNTWSKPAIVFLTASDATRPAAICMIVDPEGIRL